MAEHGPAKVGIWWRAGPVRTPAVTPCAATAFGPQESGCPSHAREQVLEGARIDRLDEIVVESRRPCLSLVLVPTIAGHRDHGAPSQ